MLSVPRTVVSMLGFSLLCLGSYVNNEMISFSSLTALCSENNKGNRKAGNPIQCTDLGSAMRTDRQTEQGCVALNHYFF